MASGSQATRSAPARLAPRIPPLPAGAWDAHSHVFASPDRFPLRHPPAYPLPAADAEAGAAFRRRLGAARGVLVQPAPYGEDPSAMLAAMAIAAGALRGVAIASPSVSDAELLAWRAAGVVGLRFVEAKTPAGTSYPGAVGFAALLALAPRLRAHGLHAELWASADELADWLPRLLPLRLPLVLDHMAGASAARGIADPAFQAVLERLADAGHLWVKLTVTRVASVGELDGARPFHEALVACAPERCVWGSDWPFLRITPPPDGRQLLERLVAWTPDAALLARILVSNPAQLYDPEETSHARP